MSKIESKTIEDINHFILNELLQIEDSKNFSEDKSLFEAGLDSLGIMRLVYFIEQHFRITIPENKISAENIGNLHKIKLLIESLTN